MKRRKRIKEKADLTGMDENSFDDELESDMEPSFSAIDLTTLATQPRIAEDQAATASPATVARRAALSGADLFLTVTAKPAGKAAGQEVTTTPLEVDEVSNGKPYLSNDEIQRRKDAKGKGRVVKEPTAKEPTTSRKGSTVKSLKRKSTAGSSTPGPLKRVKQLRSQPSVVMSSIETEEISATATYVAHRGRSFSVKSLMQPDTAKDALWAAMVNRVLDFVKRIVDSAWNSEFTNEEIAAVDLTAAASLIPTLVNNQGDIRTRAQTGTLTQMKGRAVKTFLK
ncbi:hypothetical protein OEA41_006458 [Lepraria neglecta]|uniref:Uncharacterized protein n=1 Tax=Lepraria neglecta TaxID=209136 RepID=A0AAD9Z7N8_9LECA|nr:hypothetical protein OEA41_006458 [Lepraria neglecta]